MKHLSLRYGFLFVLSFALVISFQNCSQGGFKSSDLSSSLNGSHQTASRGDDVVGESPVVVPSPPVSEPAPTFPENKTLPMGYLSEYLTTHDLYVSPTGNDGVSYASNNINNPWKTLGHALYNLKAGDRLYVRAGSYQPTYPLWMESDYSRGEYGGDPNEKNNAQSGTATAHVVVENFPGEQPVVDLSNVTSMGFVQLDRKSYWVFKGLKFINAGSVFDVGQNFPTTYITFDQLSIEQSRGGDNQGGITLINGNAQYITIRNTRIIGPGGGASIHQNTNGIYLKTNHVKIFGNHLVNFPIGIYFKHASSGTSYGSVDVEVAYNFIDRTTRASLEYNGNYNHIHHNVFGPNNSRTSINNADGGAGGDYNIIEYNTFASGGVGINGSQDGLVPGAIGNIIRYNLFVNAGPAIDIYRYNNGYSHQTQISHNFYPSNSAVRIYDSYIAVDGTSVVGPSNQVIFSGATLSSYSDFELTSESAGKGFGAFP